ncbi:MAG: nickel pincer cofactor biosynthesis protein LarB [Candidatus Hydrothermarchaeales archaeon]
MRDVLEALYQNKISVKEAEERLKARFLEIEELAKLDIHRESRAGIPEVILAEGKEPEDVVKLAKKILENEDRALITKAREEDFSNFESFKCYKEFNRKGRTIVLRNNKISNKPIGKVGILAAGTSDIPIAEETRVICEEFGCQVVKDYDVGVAGIHRLFPSIKKLRDGDVDVIVVVAGMEGALPSVVKSLVDVPVIGVPTSIGYGLGGKGVSALMGMLQSCSPGIAVVNIDNGFGAASVAYLICKRIDYTKRKEKTE